MRKLSIISELNHVSFGPLHCRKSNDGSGSHDCQSSHVSFVGLYHSEDRDLC